MRHPRQTIVSSPVGPLRLVVDDAGALTPPAVRLPEEAARAPGEPSGRSCLDEVERQLRAYFAGEREDFDVPLRPGGTPFQLAVWEALRAIPYAETRAKPNRRRRSAGHARSGRSAPPTAATRSRSSSRATGSSVRTGG
jgi:methylated-DNA-[protein]-cysteine S-methyltransferase